VINMGYDREIADFGKVGHCPGDLAALQADVIREKRNRGTQTLQQRVRRSRAG
jgi:hypothetical protein